MNISIFGEYYLPYLIDLFEKDGHFVLHNVFSSEIDVCIVESRFYMYEIYRHFKAIKRKGVKIINIVLDIPFTYFLKRWNLKNIYKEILQTLHHKTRLNRFLLETVNLFKPNSKKNVFYNLLANRIQFYFNSFYLNRTYFLKNYREYLKNSDLNLALSRYTQKLVNKFLKINTIVCYPCVNSEYLLNLPKEEIKYDAINISRIIPLKNQETFLKAAKKLGLNILILGAHNDKSIKIDCPHYYIKDNNQVMKILNQTKFYVDPSLFEGFGMTPV
ncbi:hypothetical protein LCGC14_2091430, partial [marine sediment metagenome]